MRTNSHPRPRGFTLVELLVVIGIIGLLISILLPALRKAREHAHAVVCQSNQRQLIMAFLMFANDHQQHLPGNYFDSMYQQRDPEKRDWLLGDNPNQGNSAVQYLDGPQKGTVYRYLKNMPVYLCPSYSIGSPLNSGSGSNGRFDYAATLAFSGAKITHVRPNCRFNLNGRLDYSVFTPVICEEEALGGINGGNDEGGHSNVDRLGHVHFGGGYYATIDGSVHWYLEPATATSWNWESLAPSGNYRTLGSTPCSWGFWDRQ